MGNQVQLPTLEQLQAMFANDRFAMGAGCRITRVFSVVDEQSGKEYRALEAQVTLEDKHLNGREVGMGGVAFTLGDMAMGACGHANGQEVIGLDASIQYLRTSVLGDTLIAVAKPTKLGRNVTFYEVDIRNQNGAAIAHMTGSTFVKPLG